MVMITGMYAFPAVNHAASSTLLPTLLAARNKYAIIYLHAAGGQEARRKHPTVKPHSTHTNSMLLSVLHSKTHTLLNMLAQGHNEELSFPVCVCGRMCSMHLNAFVYACV